MITMARKRQKVYIDSLKIADPEAENFTEPGNKERRL
jgi:hypothetical protein